MISSILFTILLYVCASIDFLLMPHCRNFDVCWLLVQLIIRLHLIFSLDSYERNIYTTLTQKKYYNWIEYWINVCFFVARQNLIRSVFSISSNCCSCCCQKCKVVTSYVLVQMPWVRLTSRAPDKVQIKLTTNQSSLTAWIKRDFNNVFT